MEVRNLDSRMNWADQISQICGAFPREIRISGSKFKMPRPKSVFLVNIETMDEILRLLLENEPHGFFLEYPKLKELSGKTEEEISQILTNEGTKDQQEGQPGYFVWAHQWLIEYLGTNFEMVIEPREPLVFLSPEAIMSRFPYVEDYFTRVIGEDVDVGKLRDRIVRSVVWHELGHMCFERLGKPFEPRLSEGLANFCVFTMMDDLGKEVLHTLACSPELDFRRNYYHLLRYYGSALDQITQSYLTGHRGRAFEIFEQLRRFAEAYNAVETNGGAIRIGGSINGEVWLAYGATRKSISIATELPILCNIKSGTVLARKIEKVVGFLSEELRVVTNAIEQHEYPRLPINVKVVKESELDVERVVKEEILQKNRSEEEIVEPFFP